MPDLSFDVTRIYTSTDGIKIPLLISFGGKEIQTTEYHAPRPVNSDVRWQALLTTHTRAKNGRTPSIHPR